LPPFFVLLCFCPGLVLKSLSLPSVYSISIFLSLAFSLYLCPHYEMPHMPPHMHPSSKRTHTHTHARVHTYIHTHKHTHTLPQTIHLDTNTMAASLSAPF
uniref:Uncharacterized protein n=1 Tax=Bos indicus x Bos taurus TaxID=30522 RepID=A0A4W2CWV0_BOBOX